jgi:hypothetical protein
MVSVKQFSRASAGASPSEISKPKIKNDVDAKWEYRFESSFVIFPHA